MKLHVLFDVLSIWRAKKNKVTFKLAVYFPKNDRENLLNRIDISPDQGGKRKAIL